MKQSVRSWIRVSLLAACVAAICPPTAARANLLVNGGFEDPILDEGGFTVDIPGWLKWSTIDNTAMGKWADLHDSNFAYVGCFDGSGTDISQAAAPIQPDTKYTLSVDVFPVNSASWAVSSLNYVYLAEVAPVDSSYSFVQSLGYSNVVGETVTLTATTGHTVTEGNKIAVYLGIAPGSPVGAVCYGAAYDNAVLTASPVPEPSTMALLATGLLGLIAYAWRTRG